MSIQLQLHVWCLLHSVVLPEYDLFGIRHLEHSDFWWLAWDNEDNEAFAVVADFTAAVNIDDATTAVAKPAAKAVNTFLECWNSPLGGSSLGFCILFQKFFITNKTSIQCI